MERYRYQPLPPLLNYGRTPPYTRLVSIFPGRGNEQIQCSLFVVNIEAAPAYESLSYVWGTPSGTPDPYVLCDGCPVSITPNLDRALRWLRYPHQERLFWIDAICIDQENIDERSRQVGYMRLVYAHAIRAIVWLGPKQPGMDQAFETARRMQVLKDLPPNALETGLPDVHSMLGMTKDEYEIGTFYVSELFDVEYFTRIWCVQEVAASKICIAKSEDQEMDFFDLLQLVSFVVEIRGKLIPDKPLVFWANIPVVRQMRFQSGLYGSIGPLLSMLAGTRDFKATDPRDKVFALFGVSDEGVSPDLALSKVMGDNNSLKLRLLRKAYKGISEFVNSNAPAGSREFGRPDALVPNYKKDVSVVFRDLTRFLIRASPRLLDVLSHVQHTSPPDPAKSPSWIPNWNEPRQVSIFSIGIFLAGFSNGHFRYFANVEDNSLHIPPREPDKLKVEGFKIDRVVRVTDAMAFALHEEWPAERIWRQLFDFPLFPHTEDEIMRSYRNGDRLDMAFLLAAAASPLGTIVFGMNLQSVSNATAMGDAALPTFKAEARADAAAFILENTPLDTTTLPHYATINLEAQNGNAAKFNRIAKIFCHNRRFYLTRSGYLGIGPRFMQPGDEVCVLFGGRPPFIVRPVCNHYLFMGDTYVMDEQIMWGKATEDVKRGRSPGTPVVTFELR